MAQIDRLAGLVGSTAIKTPCAVATTANITLSGEQTIDGVLTSGSRVLVKNQTSSVDNGIYLSDTGSWERTADFDGPRDVVEGTLVKVNGGSTNYGFWYVTSTGTITIGTTAITFGQASTILATVTAIGQAVIGAATAAIARTAIGAGDATQAGIQAQTYTAFTTEGSSTAYTVAPVPAITNLTTNARLRVKFNAASGATPTLTPTGWTAKNLKYYDTTGTKQAITSTQVPINWISDVEYDGTDWVVVNPASAVTYDNSVNDFRLTLTTGVPLTTTDVTGATTIFCTPFKGNRIALYDSTSWNIRTSAQFSLAVGTLTSGLPYDVFCYDNAGVPTLEFTAWTNGTTRATALAYQDGILSKSGALTRRYLGTFYTTATTTTEDSAAKRYLYNYSNRVQRPMSGTFSADRSTASGTYVELNSEIRCQFLIGVAEDPVVLNVAGSATAGAANANTATAIGIDSTTVATGGFETAGAPATSGTTGNIAISGQTILAVGFHYATLLAKTNSGTSSYLTATSAVGAKVYLGGMVAA